jgi:YggT family protein
VLVLIQIIRLTATVITWLIIIKVVLSYFMSPYHAVRQTIDQLVEPMLMPIRRIMPQTGMIDFSPLVLLILVQLIEAVLINLIVRL